MLGDARPTGLASKFLALLCASSVVATGVDRDEVTEALEGRLVGVLVRPMHLWLPQAARRGFRKIEDVLGEFGCMLGIANHRPVIGMRQEHVPSKRGSGRRIPMLLYQ